MKRKRRHNSLSRASGQRLLIAALLALVGVVGGMLIGEIAIGGRLQSSAAQSTSFARHSANPDALSPVDEGATPCFDCPNSYSPDSYGVAARLRAARADRMDAAYRDLGAVDLDDPPLEAAPEDYDYGGRFNDMDEPSAISDSAAAGDDAPYSAPPLSPVPDY